MVSRSESIDEDTHTHIYINTHTRVHKCSKTQCRLLTLYFFSSQRNDIAKRCFTRNSCPSLRRHHETSAVDFFSISLLLARNIKVISDLIPTTLHKGAPLQSTVFAILLPKILFEELDSLIKFSTALDFISYARWCFRVMRKRNSCAKYVSLNRR